MRSSRFFSVAARYLYLIGLSLLFMACRSATSQPVGVASVPPEAFPLSDLDQARRAFEQRLYTEALAAVDAALTKGTEAAAAHLLKGRIHQAQDQYDDAEAAFLEAFRCNRSWPEPLLALAEMADRQGHRGRCEELYRRILDEVDACCTPAREQLVRLYANNNQLETANEIFAGFARHGQQGAVVDRCQAYLRFRANRNENRLTEYQQELESIIGRYPGDARTRSDLAMLLFASHHYDAARLQTEGALKLSPQDLRCRELRVLIEARQLRFDVAERLLQELIAEWPRNAGYRRQLIELAWDQADFDRVVDLIRAWPAPAGLVERGGSLKGQLIEALKRAGRNEEAIATARSWLADDPADSLRRLSCLSVLTAARNFEEAVDMARQWLAADPAKVDLRLQLIEQLAAAGRLEEAQQQTLAWIAESPDELVYQGCLIRLFWLSRQWEAAIDLARVGAEEGEHQNQYEDWLCRTYLLARRYEAAATFYRQRIDWLEIYWRRAERGKDVSALRLYHEALKGVYRDLLTTLVSANRLAEAEALLNKLIGLQIEQKSAGGVGYDSAWLADLRRLLSNVYQFTDRRPLAVQQLQEIMTANPMDPGVNNDLGYLRADMGERLDEAERMVRFAVGERPREYAFLDSLGWVIYKRGRFEEALVWLQRAVRQGGNDAVIHDHLGDTLYRLGRQEEAGEQWNKALSLSKPDDLSPPTPDEQRVFVRVEEKLRQLAAGEEILPAPVTPDP